MCKLIDLNVLSYFTGDHSYAKIMHCGNGDEFEERTAVLRDEDEELNDVIRDEAGSDKESEVDMLFDNTIEIISDYEETVEDQSIASSSAEQKTTQDKELHELRQLKDAVLQILTPNQVDLLLKRKKKVKWTNEELSKAFALRYLGTTTYNTITNLIRIPQPSIRSLQRYAAKFEITAGIFSSVLTMMMAAAQTMTEFQRTCVISFDEMAISKLYEYNEREDTVYGSHKNIQVRYMQII
ncbi:uncharacterized protein LOC132266009 [Phlebotomus argentipes]|uniref:uncharacterized protein LOC132266009 n=1 Tax=Phlebotomus argentipes TaxID=94469 RepID=UPI0028932974|nr:uncharacterized protein LOC132266009 [Phlebotomus argentipes]